MGPVQINEYLYTKIGIHANRDDTEDDDDSKDISMHEEEFKSEHHEMTHESRGAKYRFFWSPKGAWNVRHRNIYVHTLY